MSTDAIPALRDDLEVNRRPDGQVDIRDPRLINVYTLDPSYIDIAVYFDGARTASEVCVLLSLAEGMEVDEPEVVAIAQELESLFLLDTPEAEEAEPSIDNKAPHSLLRGVQRRLRVIPDMQPEGRWTCQACGACCHGLAVEVSDFEEDRIDARLYEDILDGQPFAVDAVIDPEEPAQRILRQRPDRNQACVFLSEDGLCLVHARQGMEFKPDACQIFPYMIVNIPGRTPRLAMRTNCQSMHETWLTGDTAEGAIPEVKRLLTSHASLKVPSRIPVFGEQMSVAKVARLLERITERLARDGVEPKALRDVDQTFLGGRVRKSRRRFGRLVLDYLDEERHGSVPVEEGGLGEHFRNLGKPKDALEAMRRGRNPPVPTEEVARFLARQTSLALFGFGPLNLPDAGIGLVGLILCLEACLHSVGPTGSMRVANLSFMAFSSPVLENPAHAWPILDAIDEAFANELREDYKAFFANYGRW